MNDNPEKIDLSVVIMARNEEGNIRECLDSVNGWVREIVVIDDFSTDRTVEIAREYTDKVIQKKWEMEGVSRNFAYAQASSTYILSLDCDERVTPALRDEIITLFRNGPDKNAYNIPHRNYLGNYWIRYGGWYPNAKVKMFKKGTFRYEEAEYHPRAFIDGGGKQTATLKNDILHYNYRNFHALFAKLNHQTDFEARKWIRDGRKMSFPYLCRKIWSRFMKYYLGKKGYKDGFIGYFLACYAGLYQFFTYCKWWEMKNQDILQNMNVPKKNSNNKNKESLSVKG